MHHFIFLKKSITFFFIVCLSALSCAQINAYYTSARFLKENQPYVETYIAFADKSLGSEPSATGKRHNVNLNIIIRKDTIVVMKENYNIQSPDFPANAQSTSFLDLHHYDLPNGSYEVEVTVRDNINPAKSPLTILDHFVIDFNAVNIGLSSIEALERFQKATGASPYNRFGFQMIPLCSNYFPGTLKQLNFYAEAYNADKLLGKGKPLKFKYYLVNADNGTKVPGFAAITMMRTAQVTPLLASMKIDSLPSGNYDLVIEVRDSANNLHNKAKYEFQRANKAMDVTTAGQLANRRQITEYFGACNNSDTLRMFVECLWPIAGAADKDRVINMSMSRNNEAMKNYVIDFWERRAADTANPMALWATYYQRVQQVMAMFKCGKQKGYYTDRGRVYLQYGAPSQRTQVPMETGTYPYEIWQYYRTTNEANGRMSSNKKFVFVARNMGDDCFMLIHSDMPGELNNPRWRYEVSRTGTNNNSNLDNTDPNGSQNNQYNEIYNSPR